MISIFTIAMYPFLELLRLIFSASLNDAGSHAYILYIKYLVVSSSQIEMARLPESTIQGLTRLNFLNSTADLLTENGHLTLGS